MSLRRLRSPRRPTGPPAELLREIRDDVARATLTHLETPWQDRTFAGPSQQVPGGAASLAPGATATLLTMAPPSAHAWRLQELGLCVERWDDPAGTRGITVSVYKGTAPVWGLTAIRFGIGTLERRGRVYVVGSPNEVLTVRATNESGVDTLTAEAACVGFLYSVSEGQA